MLEKTIGALRWVLTAKRELIINQAVAVNSMHSTYLCSPSPACLYFHATCYHVGLFARHPVSAIVQGVLEIVDSELHLFNAVNLATAVSRVAKLCDRTVGLASAAQDPAFVQLKTAVSAPQAILCWEPCCSQLAVTLIRARCLCAALHVA